MKRPAFQFYPSDWRKDIGLQSCSLAAKGLWIELICLMHESETYGVLELNGIPIDSKTITKLIPNVSKSFPKLIQELEQNGVFSRNEKGSIYCRRMIKDERIRGMRATFGKLGGNPNLVNQNSEERSEQKPTPSTSSSTSTSVPPTPIDEFSDMPTETANDFDALQRKIRNVHPHWKKPFSRKELDTLLANAKALMAVTDLEWTTLGWFYGSEIPAEWGTFWRPDGRDRFMQDINDILIGSKRWVSECRRNGISLPGVTDQNAEL